MGWLPFMSGAQQEPRVGMPVPQAAQKGFADIVGWTRDRASGHPPLNAVFDLIHSRPDDLQNILGQAPEPGTFVLRVMA